MATAFDMFMSVICGPEYATVLRETLGPDGLARAEQEARYFFADEVPAILEWHFDGPTAGRLRAPVLLVQGGDSAPPVHRLVAHVAAMLPNAETATIDRETHLLPQRSPDTLGRLVVAYAQRHPAAATAQS